MPVYLMAEITTKTVSMTADQISSVSTALTSTVNGIVGTFVELLPIIALTTGAIFAIRFVKGRFSKLEKTK